jgi:hypothetical protein
MNQDISRIKKIAIITAAVTVAVEVVCFFILRTRPLDFMGILISGLLTLLFFMATLLVYFKASKAQSQNKLKYLLFIFFAKIIVSAAVFFVIGKFAHVNIWYLLVSFLIFFTLFLNLEIFLIYKRMLFYKN